MLEINDVYYKLLINRPKELTGKTHNVLRLHIKALITDRNQTSAPENKLSPRVFAKKTRRYIQMQPNP